MEYVERIIEAGAYRHRTDLEKKIEEEPLVDVNAEMIIILPDTQFFLRQKSASGKNVKDYAKTYKIGSFIKPTALDARHLSAITAGENGLDLQIKSCFDVIDNSFQQKQEYQGQIIRKITYSQNKHYALLEKQGLAYASLLSISLETILKDEQFVSLHAKASIVGPLAEEKSRLAKLIIDYWKQNSLLLMNDVIKRDEPPAMSYVDGSIKAQAFKIFLEEYILQSGLSFDTQIKTQFEEIKENAEPKISFDELRRKFMVAAREQFPVKLIKEE